MSVRKIREQIKQLMWELEAMTAGDASTVDAVVLRIKISKLRRLLDQSEGLSR